MRTRLLLREEDLKTFPYESNSDKTVIDYEEVDYNNTDNFSMAISADDEDCVFLRSFRAASDGIYELQLTNFEYPKNSEGFDMFSTIIDDQLHRKETIAWKNHGEIDKFVCKLDSKTVLQMRKIKLHAGDGIVLWLKCMKKPDSSAMSRAYFKFQKAASLNASTHPTLEGLVCVAGFLFVFYLILAIFMF